MAGCEFNRQLEIDKYVENKEVRGERFAREYLKTNMAHYRAKETGQAVPSWDVYLTDKGLTTADGEGLLELTGQPLSSHFSGQISSDIKMRVPIEMETVRHANALAASGADTIFMPEHISENGGIFVRFVTKYQRDSTDPNKYSGSQIDLGKNMAPEEARIKMQDMVGDSHFARSLQSNTYKDAYAFGTEKARRGDSELSSNRLRHLSIREPILQQSPILIVEKPVRQNRLYSTDPLGHVFNDVARIGKSVAVETATTAIMTGKYLFERIHKKKKKRPEVSISTINRRNSKQEIKPSEKIDRFNLIIYKRHAEMRGAKNALVIIRETDVGVGAIPFLISVLVREPPAPIKTVEKSMRRHEKRKLRNAKRETQKDFVKIQPLRSEGIEPLRAAKERKKRQKSGREKGTKRIAAASEKIPSASKKPEGREKKRLRRVVEKSVKRHEKRELRMKNKELRRIIKREAKIDSVKVQPLKTERVEPLKERKQSIQKKEREAVAGIVFGWMVWMILTRKDSETPKNNFKRSHPALQGETLRRQEVTSWILLSIIYYLTAIREQGMHNYPIKKKRRTLPKKGIIFSFAS